MSEGKRMADTISAAAAWVPDARISFVSQQDLFGPAGAEGGVAHIPGSTFAADPPPSLVVDFVTLTPDASGWTDLAAAQDQPSPTGGVGYVSDVQGASGPVIVGALATD